MYLSLINLIICLKTSRLKEQIIPNTYLIWPSSKSLILDSYSWLSGPDSLLTGLFLSLYHPEFPEHRDESAGPECGDPEDSALPEQRDWEHQKAPGHAWEPGSCLQRPA